MGAPFVTGSGVYTGGGCLGDSYHIILHIVMIYFWVIGCFICCLLHLCAFYTYIHVRVDTVISCNEIKKVFCILYFVWRCKQFVFNWTCNVCRFSAAHRLCAQRWGPSDGPGGGLGDGGSLSPGCAGKFRSASKLWPLFNLAWKLQAVRAG